MRRRKRRGQVRRVAQQMLESTASVAKREMKKREGNKDKVLVVQNRRLLFPACCAFLCRCDGELHSRSSFDVVQQNLSSSEVCKHAPSASL